MNRPTSILVGVVLLFIGFLVSREVSDSDDLPAFSLDNQKKTYVEIFFTGAGGGVYQINDALSMCDVINLTDEASPWNQSLCHISLDNGSRWLIRKNPRGIELVEKGWMNAGKRIALSIPLHPDRMTRDDWPVLPGIGEKLAARIEQDRQKNGDFGSFDKLVRVKGIGKKRLDSWRRYFSDS